MSPPIRDGSGSSIGSIRLGDGTEISEVRTGEGDVLFSAGPPNSLVSRYKFEDNTDTTTATDSVGSNPGTITGASYTTDSEVGSRALDFDGSNDTVDVGDKSSLDFGLGDFSITFHAKFRNTSSIQEPVNKEAAGGSTIGYFIRNASGDLLFQTSDGNANTLNAAGAVVGNTYAFYAVTREQNTEKVIYVDGSQVASQSTSIGDISTGTSFNFGSRNGNDLFADVVLDDLRIYNKALTSTEVSNLFNTGTI